MSNLNRIGSIVCAWLCLVGVAGCKPSPDPEEIRAVREKSSCYKILRGLQAGRIAPEMVDYYNFQLQISYLAADGTISHFGFEEGTSGPGPLPARVLANGAPDPRFIVNRGKILFQPLRIIESEGYPALPVSKVTCRFAHFPGPLPEARENGIQQRKISMTVPSQPSTSGQTTENLDFGGTRTPTSEPVEFEYNCFIYDVANNRVLSCIESAEERKRQRLPPFS